jgi:hypothetical protein
LRKILDDPPHRQTIVPPCATRIDDAHVEPGRLAADQNVMKKEILMMNSGIVHAPHDDRHAGNHCLFARKARAGLPDGLAVGARAQSNSVNSVRRSSVKSRERSPTSPKATGVSVGTPAS